MPLIAPSAAPAPTPGSPAPASLAEDMRRVIELFADAPGGMIVTAGPRHEIVMLNAAYAAWIGHRQVVGLSVGEAFPSLGPDFLALLDQVYATGRSEVIHGSRTPIPRPDGRPPREAYVNFVLQPIRDAGGAVCGIFSQGHEVTNEKLADEKLRQAQKMEVVGRLTGGIAHDFNNLLTVVIGATETLAEALADRPDLAPVARVALEAAGRGAELVSQLMAVSRTQSLAPQTINCNRFLEGLLPMLQRTLGVEIEVAMVPAEGEVCCLADQTQLTSAMLNLCINARDAMPEGGRLTLRAAAGAEPADLVAFAVEDTGEGMSAATRARALEPFFTTKPEGKGSGLGLSMVQGFAIQSGGRLEIETAEGVGTTVAIRLPRTSPCAETPRAQARSPALAPGLRVLLVEDDDMVRAEVTRQLEALGCEVRACAGGHDALDAMAAGEAVDLMMTDINMPGGLNGRQLADHARLLDPSLRILFSSGHTEDPVLRTAGRDPRSAFLAKPYRRAQLAAKLGSLMARG